MKVDFSKENFVIDFEIEGVEGKIGFYIEKDSTPEQAFERLEALLLSIEDFVNEKKKELLI